MSDMIWIHDDGLSPTSRVFDGPEAPAVYVFDDTFIEARGYGLKRLAFIYECLLEMPVEIHKGPLTATVATLAAARAASRIRTMDTPDPLLRRTIEALRTDFEVEVISPPTFAGLSGRVDLKRFSRYWKKAQSAAFLPTMKQD
ncbi:MAG: hypothetical protein ACFB6R_07230 [Alphaproteobacteria bacterium]